MVMMIRLMLGLILLSMLTGCVAEQSDPSVQALEAEPTTQEPEASESDVIMRRESRTQEFSGAPPRRVSGQPIGDGDIGFTVDVPLETNETIFEVVFTELGAPTYNITITTPYYTHTSERVDGEDPWVFYTDFVGKIEVSIQGNGLDLGSRWEARVITSVFVPADL